jgi:trehalose-phosphatase
MIKMKDQYDRWLADEVRCAQDRVLLADYDGILAPAALGSDKALPFPGIRDALSVVMQHHTRVIAISSRPAYEVSALLDMQPSPEIWGNDGLEKLSADGCYKCGELDVPLELLRALAQCEVELEQEGLSEQIETRLTGLTVRWRGLSPAKKLGTRTTAFRTIHPLAARYAQLRLIVAEEGLEVRLPVVGKRDAMRSLLQTTPPDVPVAYLGHSAADEELFRLLNGRGLTVLVRTVPRLTAAQIHLRSVDEVICFLQSWVCASKGHS